MWAEIAIAIASFAALAGATTVYVGPNLPLDGPAGVVVPLINHDNHLHAQLLVQAGGLHHFQRRLRQAQRGSTRP